MIKLKSHVGLDMKLGGLEQRATIFVAETISGQMSMMSIGLQA